VFVGGFMSYFCFFVFVCRRVHVLFLVFCVCL
jgi:hypothetical protein